MGNAAAGDRFTHIYVIEITMEIVNCAAASQAGITITTNGGK